MLFRAIKTWASQHAIRPNNLELYSNANYSDRDMPISSHSP